MSQHREKRGAGAGGTSRTKAKGMQWVGGVSAGRGGVKETSSGGSGTHSRFQKSHLQSKVAISGVHTARTAQGAGVRASEEETFILNPYTREVILDRVVGSNTLSEPLSRSARARGGLLAKSVMTQHATIKSR